MNLCYVTPRGAKTYESADEVRAAWTDGAEFRAYKHCSIVTKGDTNHLLRARFTYVRVVWQNASFRVMHCDIELKGIPQTH